MPYDVPTPSLSELDQEMENFREALLVFEDSDDISVHLINSGEGVQWRLKAQSLLYSELDDAAGLAMSSDTPIAVCDLTVPAGAKVLVTGMVVFAPNASVTASQVAAGCGISPTALPAVGQYAGMPWGGTSVIRLSMPIPERFFDNSAGTTPVLVSLVANCVFSAGAVTVSGWLRGRRIK